MAKIYFHHQCIWRVPVGANRVPFQLELHTSNFSKKIDDGPRRRAQIIEQKSFDETGDATKTESMDEGSGATTLDLIIDAAKKTGVHGVPHIVAARKPIVAILWALIIITALGMSIRHKYLIYITIWIGDVLEKCVVVWTSKLMVRYVFFNLYPGTLVVINMPFLLMSRCQKNRVFMIITSVLALWKCYQNLSRWLLFTQCNGETIWIKLKNWLSKSPFKAHFWWLIAGNTSYYTLSLEQFLWMALLSDEIFRTNNHNMLYLHIHTNSPTVLLFLSGIENMRTFRRREVSRYLRVERQPHLKFPTITLCNFNDYSRKFLAEIGFCVPDGMLEVRTMFGRAFLWNIGIV